MKKLHSGNNPSAGQGQCAGNGGCGPGPTVEEMD